MRKFFLMLLAVAFTAAEARAADWTAVKLRGLVFVNTIAGDGAWVRLRRGDIVDDARVIRTLGDGSVEFQSGVQSIAFGPATQAEIADRARGRGTIVIEQAGTVAISAEVRAVPHFSVETPYLVAAVKGTVFSVRTNRAGSSVTVSRGLVVVTGWQVGRQVLLPAGRSIVVAADGRTGLSGTALPALVHPLIGGVIEDGDQPASINAPLPGNTTAIGIGESVGVLAAGVGSTAGDLGKTTGVVGNTVGTVAGDLGGTIGGLGGALGGLGSGTGGLGSTLGAVTGTLGTTVSSVGANVGNLGAAVGTTVNGAGATSAGTVGGITGAVGSTVGGALTHLGL